MSDLPKFVTFHEEGPREGFQIEKRLYSVQDRVELVDALARSGLSQVQVGSFVSAKAVPTMADIDQVFAGITRQEGVRYTALWLNEAGFRKAQATAQVDISAYLMFYTTDALSLRNNNCTAQEMRERQEKWISLYKDAGAPIESAYIVTAFGCNLQGEVPIADTVAAARHIIKLAREHEIGFQFSDGVQRLTGFLRLAANRQVRLFGDELSQSLTHHGMVINDKDALYIFSGSHESFLNEQVTIVPFPLARRMSSEPPTMPAR